MWISAIVIGPPFTSAGRPFGSSYFSYSAPVAGPRHIGARPKEDSLWPRSQPEAIEPLFCLGSPAPEAIETLFCLGFLA